MRRPPQLGQKPWPLQENGTSRSKAQSMHRKRAKPCASTPHVRKPLNSCSTGGDVRLDFSHPRHLDDVAAEYPDLTVVASRPAWPWQREMIAILPHKPNVWYEVHGWSPRYFTADLKVEIGRRLADRVMFGADYPMFAYERLVADWRAEGYAEDVLEKLFHRNAERFFGVAW